MTIIHKSEEYLKSLTPLMSYLEEEINTPTILFDQNVSKYVEYTALPNNQELGKRLKKAFNKNFRDAVSNLSIAQIQEYRTNGKISVQGVELSQATEDLVIRMKYVNEGLPDYFVLGGEDDVCILLDTRQDEKLQNVGIAREVVNKVQRMRKNAGLRVDDDIIIFYQLGEKSANLRRGVEKEKALIDQIVKKPFLNASLRQSHLHEICKNSCEYEEETYEISICWSNVLFNEGEIQVKRIF